jgi:hypothetical protein
MTVWLRVEPKPAIEAAEARQSEILRIIGDDYKPTFEDIATVLNVFDPGNDNQGEILILSRRWEGFSIQLFHYADTGSLQTGASFGGGA